MKIFILFFYFLGFFYVTYSIEIKNIDQKNLIKDIYHPIYQDYQYWTEYHKKKQILDTKSLSIKKYNFNNFLITDNIYQKKEFFFPKINKLSFSFYKKNNRINDVLFSRKNIRYFDVKTPTSKFFYIHDWFSTKTLGGLFTHSPNKNINYSIEYKNVFFENKLILKKVHNYFAITFNKWKKNPYYKLWGHYLNQNFYVKKQIKKNLWNTTKNLNYFLDQKDIYHERLYISFIKKIFPKLSYLYNEKSIYFKNNIEYTTYIINTLEQNKLIKNKKNFFFYKNYNALILKNKKKYNLELGFLYEKIYSQYFYNNFLDKGFNYHKNPYKKINLFSIITKIYDIFNKKINFQYHKKWIFNDKSESNPLQINFKIDTILFSNFHFLTKISINKNIYSDFINFYIFQKNGNYYNNKINNLLNYKSINFSFFKEKNFNIFFKKYNINNIDFLNTKHKLLNWNYINLWSFQIKKIYKIGNFQLNNIIFLQKQNSDNLIFSIPYLFYKSTIFYKKTYFNKSFLMKTGCSIHYFNHYFYQNFSYPFDLLNWYPKNEYSVNFFVQNMFIDYFFNFKIFRTNFYTSVQNIRLNKPFCHKDFLIRIGLFWNIFT